MEFLNKGAYSKSTLVSISLGQSMRCRRRSFENLDSRTNVANCGRFVLNELKYKHHSPNVFLKINDPQSWPIRDKSPAASIPRSDSFLNAISQLLDGRTPVNEVLSETLRPDSLHLLLVTSGKYSARSGKRMLTSSLNSAPSKRVLWCAIAGRNEVIRVDSDNCKYVADLEDAVREQGRLGLVSTQVAIWKVCLGCLLLDFSEYTREGQRSTQMDGSRHCSWLCKGAKRQRTPSRDRRQLLSSPLCRRCFRGCYFFGLRSTVFGDYLRD